MDNKFTVKSGGVDYPCYVTMGAALTFKDLAGHDIDTINGTADVVTYIYACVKSACAREKKDFTLSLQEFADGLSVEEMTAASQALTTIVSGEAEDSKKK